MYTFMTILKILALIISVVLVYTIFNYVVPGPGQAIDTKFKIGMHKFLTKQIDGVLWKVEDTKSDIQKVVDNPTPNSSRRLEQRTDF